MTEVPDDHGDMLDAVRSAMETHADSATESPHSSEATIEQREADQSAVDMGLAVAAQLNAEDRQRSAEPSKKTRDGRGRFTSATSTGVDSSSVHGTADALHVPLPEASAVQRPPSSWSPEAKAAFSDLPAAVQQAVLKREDEMNRGVQDYRARSQSHAQIESMMAPRRQAFQQYGMKSDAEAIERLLLVSDGMATNPSGTLAFLAQQFGVAPHQVFSNMQSGPSQDQIEQYVQQRIENALAQTEVQRFESKAPEYYGLVKGLMQQLLQQGAAASMQDAYRQACQHHPAVQSIEQQRQVRERRERQIRAANASLSGAPHGTPATPPRSNSSSHGKFGDVADDVRAAMASLS
jgi:hypothetical protein